MKKGVDKTIYEWYYNEAVANDWWTSKALKKDLKKFKKVVDKAKKIWYINLAVADNDNSALKTRAKTNKVRLEPW